MTDIYYLLGDKDETPWPYIYLNDTIDYNNTIYVQHLHLIKKSHIDKMDLSIDDNVFVIFDKNIRKIVKLYKNENEITFNTDADKENSYIYSTNVKSNAIDGLER